MKTTQRITSLEDHRAFLRNTINSAQQQVIIVSPFISDKAMSADRIPKLIRSVSDRGVRVSVFTDNNLNRDDGGNLKPAANDGIKSLVNSGAKVFVADRVHNKTLIRDNDLIAEGSFNWLSAVRREGAHTQCEERTLVVSGEDAAEMIASEVAALEKVLIGEVGLVNNSQQGVVIAPRQRFARKTKVAWWVFWVVANIVALYLFFGGGLWEYGMWAAWWVVLTIGVDVCTFLFAMPVKSRFDDDVDSYLDYSLFFK